MKKMKLNCAATMEETFADFLTSRKAKGFFGFAKVPSLGRQSKHGFVRVACKDFSFLYG